MVRLPFHSLRTYNFENNGAREEEGLKSLSTNSQMEVKVGKPSKQTRYTLSLHSLSNI